MPVTRIQAFLHAIVFLLFCTSATTAQISSSSSPQSRTSPERTVREHPGQYVRMATAIGDDYFDGKESTERIRRHMQLARALGVRYLRCAFSWNGIEPARGQYRFAFWDRLVDEAERAGVTLIPYVAYTPEWAASTEEGFWKQPPANPEDYARLMRTLAERYRGRIRHWELWNEPDNREYWAGSPDQFATMVKAAAQAVRATAPEVVLVLGGMSQGPGEFFTVLVSRHHLQQHVDVLALHAYPESWHEERAETAFGPWIEQMHAVTRRYGLKLWLNEMGYADYRFRPHHASLWGTNTFYSYEHTPRYAAEFLFKSFVLTLASGKVTLAGWYRIDDFREDDPRMPHDKVNHHLGIVNLDGRPKPAFHALRFFNTLFSQPTRRISEKVPPASSQAVVRVFQRKDGRVIVTGWLRSSNYSEVAVHSGMLRDSRRERVDVALPCTAARVTTFNVLGTRLATGHRPRRVLRGIELSGDRVYVAAVTCASRARKSRLTPRQSHSLP